MPTYSVKDPQTGKTVVLKGDSPPTEAELTEIFASINQQPADQPAAAPPTAPASTGGNPGSVRGAGSLEVLKGLGKGVASTAVNLGRIARLVTPFTDNDAIPAGAAEALGLGASNPLQSLGKGVEQVGEFFLPGGPAKGVKLLQRIAAELMSAGGVATAQGGGPVEVVTAAGLGAAGPAVAAGVGKVAGKVSKRLKASSVDDITHALNPTTRRMKAKTANIAPEIQKRGIVGSLDDVKTAATTNRASLGEDIDLALMKSSENPVDLKPVRDAILREKASTYNLVKQPDGISKAVTHDPRKAAQVEKLEKLIDEYGDEMTTEQAVAVRRTWDDIVSRAGGFDEKAGGAFGVTLDDATEAGVVRPIAGALRKELAKANPDVAALNKEFKFWKDLESVSHATTSRRVGQRGNLTRNIVRGGAMAAGGASGGGMTGAVVAGEVAARAEKLFASPKWKLVSAREKARLANALMSGSDRQIGLAISRISASMAAQPAR